ncbi:hypothetical protein [Mycoplasma seminis]|uniref:Lipoprotein n=1 Tax=Mycoplasma seminis TaxID=512749 RepID=A0ABY9HAZ8_9MOLU|nr:hypothetical protein [Mycoplasma seminis]WLP85779.1 hypothetical protein Q8852_01350 [Mycoplasma seminis]
MKKLNKKYLIISAGFLTASVICAATVTGVAFSKKHKTQTPKPVEEIEVKPIAGPSNGISKIKPKYSKISLFEYNSNPFTNLEFINKELEKPENKFATIDWEDENTTFMSDLKSISNRFLINQELMEKGLKELEKVTEIELFYYKNLFMVEDLFNKIFKDNIDKLTTNPLTNEALLKIKNNKNASKDEIKTLMTSTGYFIADLSYKLQGYVGTLKFEKIDPELLKKYLPEEFNSTEEFENKFNNFKNSIKSFISWMKNVMLTDNNITQIINELEDKLFDLENQINLIHKTTLAAVNYLREGTDDFRIKNAKILIENKISTTKAGIYNQVVTIYNVLIKKLKTDVDTYNKLAAEQNPIVDNFLKLVNIKYKLFTNNIRDFYNQLKINNNDIKNLIDTFYTIFQLNSEQINQQKDEFARSKFVANINNFRHLLRNIANFLVVDQMLCNHSKY